MSFSRIFFCRRMSQSHKDQSCPDTDHIIQESLENLELSLIKKSDLSDAAKMFIAGDDKDAFKNIVQMTYERQLRFLMNEKETPEETI